MLWVVGPAIAEPTWIDIAMFWVTCGSVLVSVAIAGVAVWTGNQAKNASSEATKIASESVAIAKEAADRDAAHRELEAALRRQRERSQVVYAVLRSFSALVASSENQAYADRQADDLRQIRDATHVEAATVVSAYLANENDEKLLTWYELHYKLLTIAGGLPREDLDRELGNAKKLLADWNRELATGNDMYAVVRKIGEKRSLDLEATVVYPW